MTENSPSGYTSLAAFRRSTLDRLKKEARHRGRPADQLHREFVLQRFLARVFHDSQSPWVLRGGTGLLIRLPGARHSKDLDLLHPEHELADAVAELRDLAQLDLGDHLNWNVDSSRVSGGTAAKLKITAYIGVTAFGDFLIDLSTESHFVARLDHQRPSPVLDVPGAEPLPEFTLYPLPDQVADKVCAMYELHGEHRTAPSTRFRDLVDLALVTNAFTLDAGLTVKAIRSEEERRQITLPTELRPPGPAWRQGYREIARSTVLEEALHDLETALRAVGACLNPLLAGTVTTGRWQPTTRVWAVSRPAGGS